MAEYHVGCGAFEIYAGTLNQNKTLWKNKSVVTNEAMQAVALFLLEHEECLRFERDGKKYVLIVKALEQESILNKIRAEIEQLRLHKAQFLTNDNKVCIDSQAVLDILDKYKAESEVKE